MWFAAIVSTWIRIYWGMFGLILFFTTFMTTLCRTTNKNKARVITIIVKNRTDAEIMKRAKQFQVNIQARHCFESYTFQFFLMLKCAASQIAPCILFFKSSFVVAGVHCTPGKTQ